MNAWLANRVWQAANRREAAAFAAAVHRPRKTQEAKLRGYLRANAGTAFAREHGLTGATTTDEFRRRVPVREYADLARYIESIAAGEPAVLTSERVEMFTPTSGSTAAEKLIPRTAALRAEFAAALAPWINGLFESDPSLRDGPAYWSISPVGEQPPRRQGVVPIGFGDDDEYLSPLGRWVASGVKAVPRGVARVGSMENWRYVTLLSLLRCRSLRMVSVWHPSFFTLLLDALPACWERLLSDVRSGGVSLPEAGDVSWLKTRPDRAREDELAHASPSDVRAIWPRLRLVSCWADGPAAPHARGLKERLAGVEVQAKGLLATEAFVTIPWRGVHPVALRSHVVELEDEQGNARWLDEAREGEAFVPVITTGGGLWRYRLPDRVVVDGFAGRTPSLRFVGRADVVSDLRGEKLSDAFVGGVLAECEERCGVRLRFSSLAAVDSGPSGAARYVWLVDGDGNIEAATADLDRLLCANPHYAYARQLGQLAPLEVLVMRAVLAQRAAAAALPKKAAGAVKPVWLFTGPAARAVLEAALPVAAQQPAKNMLMNAMKSLLSNAPS